MGDGVIIKDLDSGWKEGEEVNETWKEGVMIVDRSGTDDRSREAVCPTLTLLFSSLLPRLTHS